MTVLSIIFAGLSYGVVHFAGAFSPAKIYPLPISGRFMHASFFGPMFALIVLMIVDAIVNSRSKLAAKDKSDKKTA
jgi:uncharacterized membrane protein